MDSSLLDVDSVKQLITFIPQKELVHLYSPGFVSVAYCPFLSSMVYFRNI